MGRRRKHPLHLAGAKHSLHRLCFLNSNSVSQDPWWGSPEQRHKQWTDSGHFSLNKPRGCLLVTSKASSPSGSFSPLLAKERCPVPTLNMGENSTTSMIPVPLPNIWKNSQNFSFSLGASCSDFLRLLILPALFLLLPFSHAASPHTGPQPYPSFLQNTTQWDCWAEQNCTGGLGWRLGALLLSREQTAFQGPPQALPLPPCPCRHCFCLMQCHLALCSSSTLPSPCRQTSRPWDSLLQTTCTLIYSQNIFSKEKSLPEGFCQSPNSKASNCSQPFRVTFKCPLHRFFIFALVKLVRLWDGPSWDSSEICPISPFSLPSPIVSGRGGKY